MVLAAYSPEGGGNKIKGGIREAEQHKSTGAGGRATQKYGRLCPTLSLFPPLPLPSPPPPTLILSCNEFNRACNQGVNASVELKASITSRWPQQFQNGK